MSLPKMPAEYELPSLCGANPQFNDVQKKMDEAINNALDKIEESASDIKAKMESDFAEAKEKFAKLGMPELPKLPDISLQSEMKSISSIDISTLQGRIQKEAKKLQVKNLFGDALTKKKLDFDTILKKVEESGNACSACKNFMVKEGGESTDVVEKPQNTKTAVKEGSIEKPSVVTTPAVAEGVGLKNIFGFMSGSTPIMTSTLGKALKIVGEGGPNMEGKLEELNKETEESIKAQMLANGIPIHPGIVKEENELNQNSSLFTVDKAKVDANPTARTDSKDSAFKAETGTQKPSQETTNVELFYNKLMDDFQKALTSADSSWQKLQKFVKKCESPYPKNLDDTASYPRFYGKFILSKHTNPTKFVEVNRILDNLSKTITDIRQHIERFDREIREDQGAEALAASQSKWEPELKIHTSKVSDAKKLADKTFKDFFGEGNRIFRKPTPPPGKPGGPKVNKLFLQRMAEAKRRFNLPTDRFGDDRANLDGWITEVINVKTHQSGGLLITVKLFDGSTISAKGNTMFTAVGNVIAVAHPRMTDQFKKQRDAAFAAAFEKDLQEEENKKT